MTQEQKEKIIKVLAQSTYGVIATSNLSGTPESALVTISYTPEFSIVFGSFKENRKNKNIAINSQVSMVIGWDNATTLQLEGVATVVEGEEKILLEKAHCAKHPHFEKRKGNPSHAYIKVTPRWIRYTCLATSPIEVWEVSQ